MKTILLVEDNQNQAWLYADELSEEGFKVLHASDGAEALQLTRGCRLDVVILDLRLPDMHGWEVLERLTEEQPDLPVVIHTAYDSPPGKIGTRTPDAYVCKCSNLDPLKICLKELISNHAEALA